MVISERNLKQNIYLILIIPNLKYANENMWLKLIYSDLYKRLLTNIDIIDSIRPYCVGRPVND